MSNGGIVLLNAADAMGNSSGAANLAVNDGTVNVTAGYRVTLWNAVNMTGGTLTSAAGNGDGSGNYSLNGQLNATSDSRGNPAMVSATQVGLENSNTVLNVTRGSALPAADLVVSSALTDFNGSSALTVRGNGVTIFTGSSTYSGGTTISGGTLQLGDGVANNGSVAGNIVNNAALVFANPAAQVYGGVISGSGSVTKTGVGLLSLSTPQTYSGSTAVAAGTLQLVSGSLISGFGGSGTGWTLNQVGTYSNVLAPVSSDVLTLTDNTSTGNQARSAFFNVPVTVGAFSASFVYQAAGNLEADGVAFMLQDDPRGLNALGGYGGGLGYGTANSGTQIQPSAGIGLNIYSGANSGNGLYALANGLVQSTSATAPVYLTDGDPVHVTLAYDGANNLSVTLDDLTYGSTYSTTYSVGNLSALLGGNTAYVGFSGADGSDISTQTISQFVYYGNTTNNSILPPTTALSIAKSATVDLYGGNETVGFFNGSGTVTNTFPNLPAVLTTGGDGTSQVFSGACWTAPVGWA